MGVRTPNVPAASGPLADIIGNEDIGGGVMKTVRRALADFITDAVGSILGDVQDQLDGKLDDAVSAQNRVLGRKSSGAGPVEEFTPAQLTEILSAFQGDVGLGGVKGLVPAPAGGDAAAGKYLDAAGGYSIPAPQGLVQLAAGSLPTGANLVNITNISSKFTCLLVQIKSASSATNSSGATLSIFGSANNGTSFPTTLFTSNTNAVHDGNQVTVYALIFGYQGSGDAIVLYRDTGTFNDGIGGVYSQRLIVMQPVTKSATLNALRLGLSNASFFDNGTYAVFGIY
jgi:hypothetical protein